METIENKPKIEHQIIEKKSKYRWLVTALILALIFIVLYLNGMGIYTQDTWYR